MEAGLKKTGDRFRHDITLDPTVNDGKKFNANVQAEFPALTDKNQIKQETVCKACFFPVSLPEGVCASSMRCGPFLLE